MNGKNVQGLLLNVLTLLCYAADQKSQLTYDKCKGDKCYAFVTDKKNWTEARDYCKKNKGFLAEPMNQKENEKVSFLRGVEKAWLGGNDFEREDDWKCDFSGKQIRKTCPVTETECFETWENGEPNDGGDIGNKNEDCLIYHDMFDNWNDLNCDKHLPFVCQNHSCAGSRFGPNCKDCTCIASNTEYCDVISGICRCKDRWTGGNCQTEACNASTPRCSNPNKDCDLDLGVCTCAYGFYDDGFGHCISDPCVPHPCGQGSCTNGTCNYCNPDKCKGGTCIPKPEPKNFTCECDEGYDGKYCEITDDPCKHDQKVKLCKNGGTCLVKMTGCVNVRENRLLDKRRIVLTLTLKTPSTQSRQWQWQQRYRYHFPLYSCFAWCSVSMNVIRRVNCQPSGGRKSALIYPSLLARQTQKQRVVRKDLRQLEKCLSRTTKASNPDQKTVKLSETKLACLMI